MSNVHKHPATLDDANNAYAKGTNLSFIFLILENDHMAKELQVAGQGGEKVTTSTRVELRRVILDEVSSLKKVM